MVIPSKTPFDFYKLALQSMDHDFHSCRESQISQKRRGSKMYDEIYPLNRCNIELEVM